MCTNSILADAKLPGSLSLLHWFSCHNSCFILVLNYYYYYRNHLFKNKLSNIGTDLVAGLLLHLVSCYAGGTSNTNATKFCQSNIEAPFWCAGSRARFGASGDQPATHQLWALCLCSAYVFNALPWTFELGGCSSKLIFRAFWRMASIQPIVANPDFFCFLNWGKNANKLQRVFIRLAQKWDQCILWTICFSNF